MPQLIKDGTVIDDTWQLLSEEECEAAIPSGKVIVPHTALTGIDSDRLENKDIGVWINGETELTEIGKTISELPLIAINFPGFMDGRGFSTGRILRERYQFEGELRATGSIIRDQLCYLQRCGFNAFQPSDELDLNSALSSLKDFQDYYQADVNQPEPLFRRRSA